MNDSQRSLYKNNRPISEIIIPFFLKGVQVCIKVSWQTQLLWVNAKVLRASKVSWRDTKLLKAYTKFLIEMQKSCGQIQTFCKWRGMQNFCESVQNSRGAQNLYPKFVGGTQTFSEQIQGFSGNANDLYVNKKYLRERKSFTSKFKSFVSNCKVSRGMQNIYKRMQNH